LEIPQWMLEMAACCRMRMAETPTASAEALLELKRLLSTASRQEPDLVLQAQHHFLSREGGADAILAEPTAGPATQAVSSSSEESLLGTVAARDPAADRAVARALTARALDENPRLQFNKGGA
jgi:hypothetical protein